MKRLAYLAAMVLLGIGLTLAQNAQNTKPSSDQSNSSDPSAQAQSGRTSNDQTSGNMPSHHRPKGQASRSAVPDATIHDQQSSTTSTTGPGGQNNTQPSTSTMGTTGSTPGADQVRPDNNGATMPQTANPPDQQPNSTSSPDSAPPHAYLLQTPAARAVSTHTPDPGTCMNPAALQTNADGSQPTAAPRCK